MTGLVAMLLCGAGPDKVEKIDLGEPSPPLEQTTAAPAPASTTEVRGWSRNRLWWGMTDEAQYYPEAEPLFVPYDAWVADELLYLSLRYQHERRFEISTSAFLRWRLTGDTILDTDNGVRLDGTSVHGRFSPELHEAFVGWHGSSFDVRLGQQRLAWGVSDAVRPNDVLNPADQRDPLLSASEEQYLPVPALRCDWESTLLGIQGVWIPFFRPNRFDAWGSNWSLLQPSAPIWVRGLYSVAAAATSPNLADVLRTTVQDGGLPEDTLAHPTLGARLSWHAAGVDARQYYSYGFSPTPRVEVDPTALAALALVDWTTANPASLAPLVTQMLSGQSLAKVDYPRQHHIGADLQSSFGSFVVRLDTSFVSSVVFYDRSLAPSLHPIGAAVAGVEYHGGEQDEFLSVETFYQHLVDAPPDSTLLGFNANTYGAAFNLTWPLWERWQVEVRALLVVPFSYTLRPQLGWKSNAFRVQVGVLWLGGDPGSFGDYFARNRGGFATFTAMF